MLGDWQIPRIARMETVEERTVVELDVPGRAGNLLQDLDRRATRFLIAGSLYGDEARDEFLEQIRQRYRAGEPVTFVADILTATDVQHVLIERLEFVEQAGAPDQVDYLVMCVESPPPPPPPSPLGGLDTSILDQAGSLVDAVGDALGAIDSLSVPDFGDPTRALAGVLDSARAAIDGLGGASGPLTDLFGPEG